MSALLKISDAHVAYGKVEAVRSVSLEVADNEIVTIIGANGAGKTTLLNARVLPPSPARTWRRSISRTASQLASASCPNIANCSAP
jgi:ABC-type branched-subunit amino acid transport system ATPase component